MKSVEEMRQELNGICDSNPACIYCSLEPAKREYGGCGAFLRSADGNIIKTVYDKYVPNREISITRREAPRKPNITASHIETLFRNPEASSEIKGYESTLKINFPPGTPKKSIATMAIKQYYKIHPPANLDLSTLTEAIKDLLNN